MITEEHHFLGEESPDVTPGEEKGEDERAWKSVEKGLTMFCRDELL